MVVTTTRKVSVKTSMQKKVKKKKSKKKKKTKHGQVFFFQYSYRPLSCMQQPHHAMKCKGSIDFIE